MFFMIGEPLKLSAIEPKNINRSKARSLVSVAVIDDQDFKYLDTLKQHKYNIVKFDDIDDLTKIEPYDIIICDIKGVGKSFDSKFEGGHLIKEIKLRYPEKILVAYSGSKFDPTFQRFLKYSDTTMSKNADSSEWSDKLDRSAEFFWNPKLRWNRIRLILLDRDVELGMILRLEQAYIKAVTLGKKDLVLEEIEKLGDLKNDKIIKELITNLSIYVGKYIVSTLTS